MKLAVILVLLAVVCVVHGGMMDTIQSIPIFGTGVSMFMGMMESMPFIGPMVKKFTGSDKKEEKKDDSKDEKKDDSTAEKKEEEKKT